MDGKRQSVDKGAGAGGGGGQHGEMTPLFARATGLEQSPVERPKSTSAAAQLRYGAVDSDHPIPFRSYDLPAPSRRLIARASSGGSSYCGTDDGGESTATGITNGGRGDGAPSHNNSLALESLSIGGVWTLLLLPYVIMAVALSIDMHPRLKSSSAGFKGFSPECGDAGGGGGKQGDGMTCVKVVNSNYSTLYSRRFNLPLQATFFHLEASLGPAVAWHPSANTTLSPGILPPINNQTMANITDADMNSTFGDPQLFESDDDELGPASTVLSARLEVPVKGDEGAVDDGWKTLSAGWRDGSTPATSHRVLLNDCLKAGPGACNHLTLLAVQFDTPGIDRGFQSCRVVATVQGPAAASVMPRLEFEAKHDSRAYVLIGAALRFVLIVITCIGMYLWVREMRREKPDVLSWLPEQQHAAFLLPVLLLWQDPLSLVLVFVRQPGPKTLLMSDLLHSWGYQTLLLIWLCIMQGLRCYEAPRDARARAVGHDTFARPDKTILWPPKHHPQGEYFSDFVTPKLVFWGLSLVAVGILSALRYPQLLRGPLGNLSPDALKSVYTLCSIMVFAIMIVWYLAFARAVVETGRALRQQPYMQTRAQQLSYRFFVQVIILVLVLKATGILTQAAGTLHIIREHLKDPSALWRAELSPESLELPLWMSSFRVPTGEVLFVSVACYAMAFIFLPAHRWSGSDVGGGGYPHVSLQSEQTELEKTRRSSVFQRRGKRPVFCLETACWLMEAAWQVYYDPDGRFHQVTDEAVGAGKMSLGNLGLELESYITDPATDTHAILARGRGYLVLSFRGTFSRANMLTDIKMGQVPLPEMAMAKQPYEVRHHLRRDASNSFGSSYVQPYSNHNSAVSSVHSSPTKDRRASHIIMAAARKFLRKGSSLRESSSEHETKVPDLVPPVAGTRKTRFSPPPLKGLLGRGGGVGGITMSLNGGVVHRAEEEEGEGDVATAEQVLEAGLRPPPAPFNQCAHGSDAPGDEQERPGRWFWGACKGCIQRVPAIRQALPHVHQGFWVAYTAVRAEILRAIKQAVDCEYAPILITGHSLGGALAMLAAYDITVNFNLPDRIRVYTYGAPRLGNPAFVRAYDAKVPASFRVVVDGDIVAGLPKMLGIYKHAGCEVLVDADHSGNIIVKPSVVEKALRMKTRNSTNAHSLETYRDCMEACFSPADLVVYLPKVVGLGNRTSADDELPDWLVGNRRSAINI